MTATMPAGVDVRGCRLYRFWVEHPVSGEIVLGYVGETVRQPFERLLEHVRDQPWIDTVVRWEKDPTVYAGKAAVLEAEVFAIRTELPLYNVRENLDNPRRVPPPVAIRQRRARDARSGGSRWVHPADRNTSDESTLIVSVRRVSVPRSWTALQVKACLWSMSWLLITLATWGFLDRHGIFQTWTQRVLCGFVAGPFLLAWSLAGAPMTRRQWRKVRRRGRKRWMR